MTGKRIGYIRVSTTDQNPERQLEGVALDKRFIDKASGKSTDRPQLQLMLEFIREDDILFVHSMDRMARSLRDLHRLVDTIISAKVSIHFIKENLVFNSMTNAVSNLTLSLMGAFAEFEHTLIKERQREGIAIAKAQGKFKGSKKKLKPEQIEIIKRYAENHTSKTRLAFDLGIHVDTLYRYLRELGVDYYVKENMAKRFSKRKFDNENSDNRYTRCGKNNDVVLAGSTTEEAREKCQNSTGSSAELPIST